jgi:flavin-dependent dehydrogenase
MVEVLIAGAGPAGAAAAILLARAGVRVLLVDRARFPREKLCGDTLNPGALRILERLGVRPAIDARGLALRGMLLTGPSGVQVRGLYGGSFVGRALTRRDLDVMLVQAAVAAGVQFQEEVRVIEPLVDEEAGQPVGRGAVLAPRDGRRLRVPAALTMAADGRRSALAFALGLARQPAHPRRWVIGGYFEGVAGLDDSSSSSGSSGSEGMPPPGADFAGSHTAAGPIPSTRAREERHAAGGPRVSAPAGGGAGAGALGEMHIRADHYIGVAPLPGGLVNVCLVSEPHEAREGFREPAKLLLARLAADPQLRDRFARARLAAPVTMLGPLAVDAPIAGTRGLLLAGDAAGFVDPMTGDGLRFALRGGELAADVARHFLDAPEHTWHETLTHRRTQEFANKQRFNRTIRALISSPSAVRLAGRAAAITPGLLRQLISYAADLRTS